jgi:hypothetical protein
MASTVGSRLAYEKAKQAIENAGISVGRAVLSQSYLRLEVPLSTTQTLFQFPLLVNDVSTAGNAAFSTENRLALQDAFYASACALYFAKPATAQSANFQLCTYPNTTVFAAANEATSLYNWYNASMSITINNRQIVPSWPLQNHYWAGQTQETATLKDEQYGGTSALYPVEPGIVFVGSKQNVIQVQLPSAMAAAPATGRAILVFTGHLAQNCTSVR